MEENQGIESKKQGVTSKRGVYAKVAARESDIIAKLFSLMNSTNESVALGAAKTLINKILPDLRAVELTGEDQGPVQIRIIEEITAVVAGDKSND